MCPLMRALLPVYPGGPLRPRRGLHLVRMDRGGSPRPPDQPHAMGHRRASFRRGRIAAAAVGAEEGPGPRTPGRGRTRGDRARRRCSGPPCERGPALRSCGACGGPLSRRDAADGRHSCGARSARDIHGHEEDRLRADPARRLWHRVGRGRGRRARRRISATRCFSARAWPGPATLSRCVVLARRTARRRHRRGRRLAPLCTGLPARRGDESREGSVG